MNPHSCAGIYLLTLFLSVFSLRATDAFFNPALCAQAQKSMQRSAAGAVVCSSLAAVLCGSTLYLKHIQKKKTLDQSDQKKRLRRMLLMMCGAGCSASALAALFLAARSGLLWRKIAQGKRDLQAGVPALDAWEKDKEAQRRAAAEWEAGRKKRQEEERELRKKKREEEIRQSQEIKRAEKAAAQPTVVVDEQALEALLQHVGELVDRNKSLERINEELIASQQRVVSLGQEAINFQRTPSPSPSRPRSPAGAVYETGYSS